jgi:hypothetical protein
MPSWCATDVGIVITTHFVASLVRAQLGQHLDVHGQLADALANAVEQRPLSRSSARKVRAFTVSPRARRAALHGRGSWLPKPLVTSSG